jgi:hypothetical protein
LAEMTPGGALRFYIRRSWWLQPLLFLIGLTRDANSYAALEGPLLRVRFGWFFNQAFPLSAVASVEQIRWPWIYGLGWRTNFVGLVGLVASMDGVVQVRFRDRQRAGGILPFIKLPCDRLAISLRDPEGFILEVQRRIE